MKSSLFFLLILMFSSCSNFLDTENYTQKTNSTFPISIDDFDQAITAVYAAQRNCYWDQINSFVAVSNFMDPDYIANGRAMFSDPDVRANERFQVRNLDKYGGVWSNYYTGIYRANFVLESLEKENVKITDEQKNVIEGQARFLRASLYFDLCRLFGEVPLKTSTASSNPPRASIDSCFALIASDLKRSIEVSPSVPFQNIDKSKDLFDANKWSAEALMGRVFLFYTGCYKKDNMPLIDGGYLSKKEVLDYLHDVINNSGYGLIDDFRNLWLYAMTNRGNEDDYKFARDNNLKWIGEKGDNVESLYSISFSALGEWGNFNRFAHSVSCTVPGIIPFGLGSGMGAVNPKLYEEWDKNDLRCAGSIWNVWDEATEGIKFSEEPAPNTGMFYFNSSNNVEETGYLQKKYTHIYVMEGGKRVSANEVINGTSTRNGDIDSFCGIYIIRFSDVLLMAAELGSPNAQSYYNKVRSRAYFANYGNTPIENTPYYKDVNLENIKEERRHEFAFEGIRWYDLRRWGIVEEQMAKYKSNVPVYRFGIPENMSINYRPETNGLLPLPINQINLSNGVLIQNEGWDGANAIYSGI